MGSIGNRSYTSADWTSAIRRWAIQNDSVTPEDRNAIEAYIKQAPEVTNKISRGLSMSEEEFEALQVGGIFEEGKLASWTTRVGIAQAFARNNVTESKPYKVVVRLDGGTDMAAKVGTLGGRRYDEGEAIMSSKASFEITKMKVDKPNYTTIWVKRRK